MAEQLLLFDPDVLEAKLNDLDVPGLAIDFDPEEADWLGAFPEDALSEAEALASVSDLYTGELLPFWE